ncbi:hypothetical protein PV326_000191 [Microctonus aethiopoides]|nr:hypothetical protein PV326_000191 [Microctonus aethiopoides]
MEKYKKRLQRLRKNTKNNNKNDETLNTKLTRMCDPPATRKDVVKMALFGEVLNEQLKENYTGLKTQREKDIFGRVVSGARIEKYKLCRTQDSAITYETLQKATNQSLLPTKRTLLALISSENMKTVQNFYENNENSRVGARKREFVTRNEVNKQKRYSLDTMGNLYKRFKSNKSGLIMSGHGKSAADGVGATCKRSAYVIVATGGDIDSLESFIDSVQQRYPAITIFKIDDNAINNMTNDIQKDAKNLKSFICTLRYETSRGGHLLRLRIVTCLQKLIFHDNFNFKINNEDDISDVSFNQILEKLPDPDHLGSLLPLLSVVEVQ